MTDRLTAGMLRDLADAFSKFGVARPSGHNIEEHLRAEADAREREEKPATSEPMPTREDWDAFRNLIGFPRDARARLEAAARRLADGRDVIVPTDWRNQHDDKPCVWHAEYIKAEARARELERELGEALGLVEKAVRSTATWRTDASAFLVRTSPSAGEGAS